MANRLAEPWINMIVRLRREYRLTAAEIGARLRLPCSTMAARLKCLGLGRLTQLEAPPPARRYQRERPGKLLHIDIKKLAGWDFV